METLYVQYKDREMLRLNSVVVFLLQQFFYYVYGD